MRRQADNGGFIRNRPRNKLGIGRERHRATCRAAHGKLPMPSGPVPRPYHSVHNPQSAKVLPGKPGPDREQDCYYSWISYSVSFRTNCTFCPSERKGRAFGFFAAKAKYSGELNWIRCRFAFWNFWTEASIHC